MRPVGDARLVTELEVEGIALVDDMTVPCGDLAAIESPLAQAGDHREPLCCLAAGDAEGNDHALAAIRQKAFARSLHCGVPQRPAIALDEFEVAHDRRHDDPGETLDRDMLG